MGTKKWKIQLILDCTTGPTEPEIAAEKMNRVRPKNQLRAALQHLKLLMQDNIHHLLLFR